MPSVEVRGLTKTYGKVTALERVDLEIGDGEYLAIVGPSGCGKTSLIKSIAGIIKPTTGAVSISGADVTGLPIEDRGAGYVFQEIALFPHMDGASNIGYGLLIRGKPEKERRSQVAEMAHLLNLEEYLDSFPNEMSGGAKQKTAIARALATGAGLLLLDEPLGALDLKVRTSIRYELRKLVKDLGLTAVHVTHDQDEAMSICDRLVVMKAGRIIEAGPPEKLYKRPRHLFTAKFLGEANFLEGKVEEVDGDAVMVDAGVARLRARANGTSFAKGDRCVLAIRPEHIKVSGSTKGATEYSVKYVGFAGETLRIGVETGDGTRLLVKAPPTDEALMIRPGDKVGIDLGGEHVLIFEYPVDGLEKELALE